MRHLFDLSRCFVNNLRADFNNSVICRLFAARDRRLKYSIYLIQGTVSK